jgi:nicotinamidase-related amidase
MAPMALLIMDVQQGIVERFASDVGYLDRLATATAAARGAGVAVTYVTLAFRPGTRRSASATRASPRSPGLAGSPTATPACRSRRSSRQPPVR